MGLKIKLEASTPEEMNVWMSHLGYIRFGTFHDIRPAANAEPVREAPMTGVGMSDKAVPSEEPALTGVGMSDKCQEAEPSDAAVAEEAPKRRRRTKAEIEAAKAAEELAPTATEQEVPAAEPYILFNAEGGAEDSMESPQAWYDALVEMIDNAPSVDDLTSLGKTNTPTALRVRDEFPHLIKQLGEASGRRRAELTEEPTQAQTEEQPNDDKPEASSSDDTPAAAGGMDFDTVKARVAKWVKSDAANLNRLYELYEKVGIKKIDMVKDMDAAQACEKLALLSEALDEVGA